ncbi:Hydra magnipapillata [Seminavis robusta]|uniref:Hydra magnipapillata n=1 Tax=Seminavis robusta TaxID=568900 RepID=A0A9N8HH54_9STRA|nr:Hydra magnipapillata [Seminavis robusta]|eukprot:Sro431_g141520.1 Hydra magnipapillata (776) ;mRNA; f:54060-56454
MDAPKDPQEGKVGTPQNSSNKQQPEGNNDGHQLVKPDSMSDGQARAAIGAASSDTPTNQMKRACLVPDDHAVAMPPTKKAKTSRTEEIPTTPELDTLGVSVHHLQHIFLEREVGMAKKNATTGKFLSKDSSIYEIEDLEGPPGVIRTKSVNTVCPIDGKMGAAYVHSLQGEDHVGEATQMLSYSWNYSIGDIVDTLTDFCHQNNLNPKRTYIWICCLCVNQHRVVEKSKSGLLVSADEFVSIFGDRVKRIGHLLAMMAPWHAPVYNTRVWCIFEIFTAKTTVECTVDIVMPPKEKQSLEQDVVDNGGGINALYETLGNTKVENAKASFESDRLAILGQVESDVGYSVLNNQVNDLLRGWMKGVLTQLVRSRENTNNEDYVAFCNRIGNILKHNGEHVAAMKLHKTALTICETVLGKNHRLTADTFDNIGSVLKEMGDYEDALSKHKEALAIRLSALGKSHPEVAASYNNIGYVLDDMGDYEGALSKYEEALGIDLSALGKNHPDLATTYNNIGYVLHAKGDYEGALSKYERALAIRLSALGKNHPDVATTYNNIGVALKKMGDYEGALSKYEECLAITLSNLGDYEGALSKCEEALAIRLSLLGKNHPDVATTTNNIGCILDDMGDYAGALSKYEELLPLDCQPWARINPDVATTYNNIGVALKNMGDYKGALSKYEECLAITLSVVGRNHPDAATTYGNLGLVLQHMGDYKRALSRFEEALTIGLSALGKNHPDVATSYMNIGSALSCMGDYESALSKHEKALAIKLSALGKSS